MLLVLIAVPVVLYAVDNPHSPDTNPDAFGFVGYPNYYCSICHNNQGILGSTGFNNVCLTCHNPTMINGAKPFVQGDVATPYKLYTTITDGSTYSQSLKKTQSSHNWAGSDTNLMAGSSAPTNPDMQNSNISGKLLCVRCHNVHSSYSSAVNSKPFLRVRNDSDQMCLDCHRSRDHVSQTYGTHPVKVSLSAANSAHPGKYVGANPTNANPSNPTSALPLYSGVLLCSTCHGVHYTDGRSSHLMNQANWAKLSSSRGTLVRTDTFGKTAATINICTNCHIGVNHNVGGQNIQCVDCHSGHVDYISPADIAAGEGTPNIYLVRRYMNYSSDANGKNTVKLNSYRKKVIYWNSSGWRSNKNTGVCQGCHKLPSSVSAHSDPTVNNASKCMQCHTGGTHSAVAPIGCTGCHGSPPEHTVAGTIGTASNPSSGYAVYSSVNDKTKITMSYLNSGVYKNESTAGHPTHSAGKPYSFACSQCHDKNVATHDINIANTYQNVPFTAAGAYSLGATFVAGAKRSTCNNAYCHSYGTAAVKGAKFVIWSGGTNGGVRNSILSSASRCIKCHNGVSGGFDNLSTNSHDRHVSIARGKQILCSVCHSATVSDNTTISSYANHVNNSREVQFNGAFINATAAVKLVGSTFVGTNCTTYCHTDGRGSGPLQVLDWTTRATGKCGTCHKTAVDIGFGLMNTGAHFAHISSSYGPKRNTNTLCNTCHVYGGDLTSNHADGHLNMLATNLCIKCHGQSTPTWTGGSVTCWSCHSGRGNGTTDTYANRSWSNYDGTGVQAPFKSYTTFVNGGHGQAAAPYSSSISCITCHDEKSYHITGTLGDSRRLPAGQDTSSFWSASAGNNALCSTCHIAGQSAQNKVRLTHVVSHGGTGTMACARCHDVHGKAKNDHMVSDQIYFNTISSAVAISYRYTNGVTPYNFITANNRGICQVCHTMTNHFRRDKAESTATLGSGWNVSTGTDHRPFTTSTDCLSCHQHNSGNWAFYPQGNCNSCHGYPPLPKSYPKGVGNYNDGSFEDYSGAGGSHVAAGHVPAGAKWTSGFNLCDGCHTPSDHNTSGVKNPWRTNQTTGVKVNVRGRLRFDPSVQPKYSSNRLDGGPHVPGKCSNVSCHFQMTPKSWGNK